MVFERSSETQNEAIVSAELARIENLKRELGFAHKVMIFGEILRMVQKGKKVQKVQKVQAYHFQYIARNFRLGRY